MQSCPKSPSCLCTHTPVSYIPKKTYIPNVPAGVFISCRSYFTVNRFFIYLAKGNIECVSNRVWILNHEESRCMFEYVQRRNGDYINLKSCTGCVKEYLFLKKKSNANPLESGSRCRLPCDEKTKSLLTLLSCYEKTKSLLVRWFSSIPVPFQFIQRREATLIFL